MSRAARPGRRPTSPAHLLSIVPVSMLVLALALTACGGGDGGGGGGGGGSAVVHVLVVNHTKNDVAVSYSGGDPVAASADKPPVKSCTAAVIDYPLTPDPFTVSVDGKVALDSTQSIPQLVNQGQADAVAQIDVNEGGATTTTGVSVGQFIQKPAQLGICIT